MCVVCAADDGLVVEQTQKACVFAGRSGYPQNECRAKDREDAASTQYSHPIMSRVVPSKSCARGWTLPDPNHKTRGISDFPQTQNPITQVARRPAMAVVLLPNNDDNEEDD